MVDGTQIIGAWQNTKDEQAMQAVVIKGERFYMMGVIGKLIEWRTQFDQIVVEDGITSMYVQAPQAAVQALHKALKKDGQHDYMGVH